ncbi:hypothetical protein Efla_002670 [Eimeria flavescens]
MCSEMGSTGSRGAFPGDRMDRLNRIIPGLDLSIFTYKMPGYTLITTFRVSAAESQSSRMRTPLQDAWRELFSACERLQGARSVKEDSGKSEEAIATLTSQRDDFRSENGKLREEVERTKGKRAAETTV